MLGRCGFVVDGQVFSLVAAQLERRCIDGGSGSIVSRFIN